jgi:hypothetical protein
VSGEVVRLPTAAKRKVRYPQTKAENAAAERHFPKFPETRSRYARAPWMRKALEQAKLMDNVEQTPAFALALALFMACGKLERSKARAFLAIMTMKDGPSRSAASALAWLQYQEADEMDKASIIQALSAVRDGEVE